MKVASMPQVKTDFDTLKEVIVCSPRAMEIQEVINDTQEEYAGSNIDKKEAVKQHNNMIEVFEREQVKVHTLAVDEALPEQVYTRDLGVVIDNTLVVGKMKQNIRKKETEVFKGWLKEHGITYYEITKGALEGGDVVISKNNIYVGQSGRTEASAIEELAALFPGRRVEKVPIEDKYLHLDCVFNPFSEEYALLYPNAMSEEWADTLRSRYKCIEVTEDEQFNLGVNIFSIGHNTVISQDKCKRINKELRNAGFTVYEVSFSEIIKSGGCFRCVTFPISRQ
ncbi:dimethylarginine dimethylaminohydrolase family protein [Bacillus sp. FJAT-44742]|uniref:dimethylarginine dimethylaminohydrolase family protein n=1 Tax=Bacillus sp. FJAT-44742 TaxID=2014005 RepID=UPI000C24CCCA|nr:arginine deiminase family protein [Bacillus sp. FJAT-44742]